MHRLRAVVSNEDIAVAEVLSPAPVHNLTFEARHEVLTRFVVGRVVQLNTENVPVVERHQPPTISRFECAGAVMPGYADHPFKEFSFKHFAAPETLRRCRAGQCWH